MTPKCLTQTLDHESLSAAQSFYHYSNSTNEIQVVRLINARDRPISRVVFPQQRILFEAISEGTIEIYVGKNGKKVLQQVIDCQDLSGVKI